MNGDRSFTYNVRAGENKFNVAGKHSGLGAYLGGSISTLGEADIGAKLAQSGSSVLISDKPNTSIKDGLKNQRGDNPKKEIYNVNTIGYRDSTIQRSDSLSALLSEDTCEYVKTRVRDGFMVMAKAGENLKTLRLVLGVKNATAAINVELSDASARDFAKTVTAGEEENEFVVEIPFRASSGGDNYLLVKYTIEKAGPDGQVALKAIMLEDGGTEKK
jgi:hypothetical protein